MHCIREYTIKELIAQLIRVQLATFKKKAPNLMAARKSYSQSGLKKHVSCLDFLDPIWQVSEPRLKKINISFYFILNVNFFLTCRFGIWNILRSIYSLLIDL